MVMIITNEARADSRSTIELKEHHQQSAAQSPEQLCRSTIELKVS